MDDKQPRTPDATDPNRARKAALHDGEAAGGDPALARELEAARRKTDGSSESDNSENAAGPGAGGD